MRSLVSLFPWARGEGAPTKTGVALRRSRLVDALHVVVLASFAIAQPAYDRLGKQAAFLVDSDVTPAAIYIVTVILSLIFPATLVAVQQFAACYGQRLYEAFHGILVFVLFVLIVLPICGRLDLFFRVEVVIGLALILAVAGVWCYFASRRVRTVVTLAAPGILLFPGTFLLGSSVTGILTAPPPVPIDRWPPVPVVMVVFDEFCGTSLMNVDRTIDAERFPNFARLAEGSTWFRNATTVFEETQQAVPAILSGQLPSQGARSLLPSEVPQNLFTLLESTGGYELAAFEPVTSLAGHRHRSADGRRPRLHEQIALTLDALSRVLLFHIVPSRYAPDLPPIPPLWFGVRNSMEVDRTACSAMRGTTTGTSSGNTFFDASSRRPMPRSISCISSCRISVGAISPPARAMPRMTTMWTS